MFEIRKESVAALLLSIWEDLVYFSSLLEMDVKLW
jgi:hypothetical protein